MSGLQVDARAWQSIFSLTVCGHVLSDDVSTTVGLWTIMCFKMVWIM